MGDKDGEVPEGEEEAKPQVSRLPEPKVRLDDNGIGFINYPSGNIAVNVTETIKGKLSMFCADSDKVRALANFDHRGVGAVCFASGQPQLVTTMKGFSLSDEAGNMLQSERWPRLAKEPIVFEPNQFLKVSFVDRQSITLTFSYGKVQHVFDCGEVLRRKDNYLDKVVGRDQGKYILDVERIRKEPKVFTKPGPHSKVAVRAGLGSMRVALKSVKNPELKEMIQDIKFTEDRLSCLNWGTQSLYGTQKSKQQAAPGANKGSLTGTGLIEDLLNNDPVLTALGKKFQDNMKRADPYSIAKFKSHRAKLPLVKIAALDAFLGADSDRVIMVCVLADWQPGCRKWEYMLAEANHELLARGTASRNGPLMVKVDTGETRALNDKYKFNSVPMYLVYHKAMLVWASNAIVSKADVMKVFEICQAKVAKEEYLPPNFQFHGPDNKLLDEFRGADMATVASLASGVRG